MNILSKYLNLERLTLFLRYHFIAQNKRNENVCTETNRLTRSVILMYVYRSPGTCNTLEWEYSKFDFHSVEYQKLLLFFRIIDKKQKFNWLYKKHKIAIINFKWENSALIDQYTSKCYPIKFTMYSFVIWMCDWISFKLCVFDLFIQSYQCLYDMSMFLCLTFFHFMFNRLE